MIVNRLKTLFGKSRKKHGGLGKLHILLIVFLVSAVIVRIALPHIITKQVNTFLANGLPHFTGSIDGTELSIWRGAYAFNNFHMEIRQSGHEFIRIKRIDASLSWRNLFRGVASIDLIVDVPRLSPNEDLIKRLSKNPAQSGKNAQSVWQKLIPLRVDSVRIENGKLTSEHMLRVVNRKADNFTIEAVNGELKEVLNTSSSTNPEFSLSGYLGKTGKLAVNGKISANQPGKPLHTEVKISNLELKSLNSWTHFVAPFSFESGSLTMLSEINSSNGKTSGYLKPFLKSVELVGDENDFKGFVHAGTEIAIATINLIFKNSKTEELATKVDFEYDSKSKKFDWSFWETFKLLAKNGFGEPLKKKFD